MGILAERDRQVVTMRQLGYTYQQIAEALDISSKERARQLYNQAVRRLIQKEIATTSAQPR